MEVGNKQSYHNNNNNNYNNYSSICLTRTISPLLYNIYVLLISSFIDGDPNAKKVMMVDIPRTSTVGGKRKGKKKNGRNGNGNNQGQNQNRRENKGKKNKQKRRQQNHNTSQDIFGRHDDLDDDEDALESMSHWR